jgi:hypothetical protein
VSCHCNVNQFWCVIVYFKGLHFNATKRLHISTCCGRSKCRVSNQGNFFVNIPISFIIVNKQLLNSRQKLMKSQIQTAQLGANYSQLVRKILTCFPTKKFLINIILADGVKSAISPDINSPLHSSNANESILVQASGYDIAGNQICIIYFLLYSCNLQAN